MAGSGPIETTVTSPPAFSVISRAASIAGSSPGSRLPSTPSRTNRLSGPISGVPVGFGTYLANTTTFTGGDPPFG
jgi:hypothetical protein